jgi:hypothetical protein
MKINVTPENGLGTYNVSLHWETKDKIKKILGYGLLMAAGATAAWHYTKTTDQTDEIDSE